MKVTWQPAPGNVLNYRVTYKPKLGGRQLAAKVPGGNSSTVLRRLTALTTYDITVLPVYRTGEGKAREGEGTTCMSVYQTCHTRVLLRKRPVRSHAPPFFLVTPYKGPRNLQTSDPSRTSFRVTWDHAPGDVKGYKVQFHPVGEDIDLGELLVGPYDNTVVLEELRCVIGLIFFFPVISLPYGYKNSNFLAHRAGTKYTVSVFGMFDGGESLPLAGEENTTLSDDPEPSMYLPSGKVILLENPHVM